ncbi:MAG TPA: ABC transporter ATP-binding protein, partial [Stellaceae bacterium]|nr:ABC transporter ATP-binding protein [Stellaceae bacterium]
IMGLLPSPPARIGGGSVVFQGRELLGLGERAMRSIRGPGIGMIFQEPVTSLNPVFTIGEQLMETVRVHERVGRNAQRERAIDMLARVGIATPKRRLHDYPHQLSGGMRQRVMIAMALACSPKLLIADEPTTALDVTIQQQILELLLDLREELKMAIVIITHNMGVVAETADRVIVMYAGKIVERAPVGELFARPAHPYTRGLLESIPTLTDERERLKTIPGTLPNPAALPRGCRFEPRCSFRVDACAAAVPPLLAMGAGHESACIRRNELDLG